MAGGRYAPAALAVLLLLCAAVSTPAAAVPCGEAGDVEYLSGCMACEPIELSMSSDDASTPAASRRLLISGEDADAPWLVPFPSIEDDSEDDSSSSRKLSQAVTAAGGATTARKTPSSPRPRRKRRSPAPPKKTPKTPGNKGQGVAGNSKLIKQRAACTKTLPNGKLVPAACVTGAKPVRKHKAFPCNKTLPNGKVIPYPCKNKTLLACKKTIQGYTVPWPCTTSKVKKTAAKVGAVTAAGSSGDSYYYYYDDYYYGDYPLYYYYDDGSYVYDDGQENYPYNDGVQFGTRGSGKRRLLRRLRAAAGGDDDIPRPAPLPSEPHPAAAAAAAAAAAKQQPLGQCTACDAAAGYQLVKPQDGGVARCGCKPGYKPLITGFVEVACGSTTKALPTYKCVLTN